MQVFQKTYNSFAMKNLFICLINILAFSAIRRVFHSYNWGSFNEVRTINQYLKKTCLKCQQVNISYSGLRLTPTLESPKYCCLILLQMLLHNPFTHWLSFWKCYCIVYRKEFKTKLKENSRGSNKTSEIELQPFNKFLLFSVMTFGIVTTSNKEITIIL